MTRHQTRTSLPSANGAPEVPAPAREPPARLLGAHMTIVGGHDRAVRAAHRLGFGTVQVFTKGANQWAARPLTDAQIAAFRAALDETGVVRPVAHNSYLINLASPDDALWGRSIEAMAVEVERAEALGIADLVIHPGAHRGAGEQAGLDRVARALDAIGRRTAGCRVTIDLETTAGQGTCLGRTFEQLGTILARVRDPARLGVCVDTCHIFAAGYSLAGERAYNGTFEALDRAVGPGRVRVWHLNDSLRGQGSRVDRHAGLGRGRIGLEPFWRLLHDARTADRPLILETPKGIADGAELDAVNLGVLRRLAAQQDPPLPTAPIEGQPP